MEWQRGDWLITTDPNRVDLDVVHGFLTTSYWCAGITRETVQRSIEGSIPFSVFVAGRPAAYARVISDRATIAYLGDVFVLPEFRGRGLSTWLNQCIVEHPELQGLRRWILATRDAHGIYERVGYKPLKSPDRWMERHDPDVYTRG